MAPRTPRPVVTVDPKKRPWEQTIPLHNRWHPEIPPVGEVKEGELFRVETVDWTGGQIVDDDSPEDMKHIDLTSVTWNKPERCQWPILCFLLVNACVERNPVACVGIAINPLQFATNEPAG